MLLSNWPYLETSSQVPFVSFFELGNRVVLSLGDFSAIFHTGKFDNSWILVKFVNFGIEEENNLI